jgi:hypothetical protein
MSSTGSRIGSSNLQILEGEPALAPFLPKDPSCVPLASIENRASEEKPSILVFLPHLLAEQLTLMDSVSASAGQSMGGLPYGLCYPDLKNPGLELISSPNPSSTGANPTS